jgi:hypothetical protein
MPLFGKESDQAVGIAASFPVDTASVNRRQPPSIPCRRYS